MNKLFTKIIGATLGFAMAIGVGATVTNNRNDVTRADAANYNGTFNKLTGSTIETNKKYLLSYGTYLCGNGSSNSRLTNSSTTITSGAASVTNPDEGAVYIIDTKTVNNKLYYTFKNNATNKYLNGNTSNAKASLGDLNDTTSCWELTASNNTFDFTVKGGTRRLRNNGSSGWASYATGTGGALTLYKEVEVSSDKIDDSTNPFTVSQTPTVSRGGSVPEASAWSITAKLVGKDTPVSITSGLAVQGTPSTSSVGTVNVTLRYTAANGTYPLNSGNAYYDISTTMTVNPQQASVEFKQDNFIIGLNSSLTLSNEIISSGDGDLTFSITSGNEYVSISDGVLTGNALGTATIKVVKQYGNYSAFKAEDTATVEVSTVASWTHTFSTSGTADFTAASQTKTLSSASWTIDTDGGYFGVNSDFGQQIGSNSSPASYIKLTSSSFEGYSEIKSVKITTGGAKDVSATVSVKVGDTTYKCGENDSASYSLSTAGTNEYVFQATTSDCGDIIISWSQSSTSKAIYIKKIEVVYDSTPIAQGGVKASWANAKGTYYNGNITATTQFSTDHLVINTTTSTGKTYGDANATGYGFKVYLKNNAGKWVKTDKTTSDTEVVFIDASSALSTQAMTGFEAGTYSLYVTTPKESEGVWTSPSIDFVVVAKAPQTITRASEPSKTEYIAYVDTFSAFSGKINVSYNDGATGNNRNPSIKYYSGDTEVDISTYLNANKFAVNSNTTLTVRLYDNGYVGGDYVYNSYTLYIYAGTFACTDGNGASAEYESGGTVALNPAPKINYTDKDSTAKVHELTASDVDLFIKLKGASGDGEAYSGTLPEVTEETEYTITAVYKGNSAYKASYDITVVNATFSIDASGATKTFAFGTNFSKTGLVVQIQYGTAAPITIDASNYTVEDENGVELDVIKFIGTMTVTVRYLGYSATYQITGTNVGSSESNIHDDVPGEWSPEETATTINYTSSSDSIASGEFDSYTLSTGNNPRRFNNGAYLSANAAFGDDYAGSITITFNGRSPSANAGASFAFTATALSNGQVTSYTGSKTITSTSSDKEVKISITGIPYSAAVDGWRIDCAKTNGSGNANGNLIFSSLVVKYNKLVQGEAQIFNSTPMDQALSYATFFLNLTNSYCTVSLSSDVKATLSTEYNGMVAEAKALFAEATVVRGKGATYENALSEALSRYANMVEEKGTGDFLSLGNSVLQKGTNNPIALIKTNSNTASIIVVISMISIAAVGGYFFLRKRKED